MLPARRTLIPASILPVLLAAFANATPQAKWTVMVYMSGDNDLENFVVKDLERELAVPGSSEQVQVVALADRGPGYDASRGDWQSTKLFHVTPGMRADAGSAVGDWGERNMGDPQTLIDFVSWSKATYPADHYALFFWGHGWSWHPGWVMQDDSNGDTLDLDEMRAALPAIGFIDCVGYDGCNMASIEVLSLWHGHATALTGSQEWVGWDGIEYDIVLSALTANPDMTADDIAVIAAENTPTDNTWSAVAVDERFDVLLTAVDEWSAALTAALPANRQKYKNAFRATQSFFEAPMDKDLYDMAQEIDRRVTDPNIKAKCAAVMAAVDSVTLAERHLLEFTGAHGITIYHASTIREQIDHAYYGTLDFADETRWYGFLNALVP